MSLSTNANILSVGPSQPEMRRPTDFGLGIFVSVQSSSTRGGFDVCKSHSIVVSSINWPSYRSSIKLVTLLAVSATMGWSRGW